MNPSAQTEIFISRSTVTTESNKTGDWRFVRPEYQEKIAPCAAACPAGEDIARIEALASAGQWEAAWRAIIAENPFPAVCGRVCFHPCQSSCNRGRFDEPIAIHRIERYLGDLALAKGWKPETGLIQANGKRIAIVGAGPAGLTAAYFLTQWGYQCELFDAQSAPGGLLRWGIPDYRLPTEIAGHEISRIIDLGVKLHCQQRFSQDAFRQAANAGFHGVILACGDGKSIDLGIPQSHLAKNGLDFLLKLKDGNARRFSANSRIAVIGGGNTAIDVARSLVRLGAEPIICYRRRIVDMPAFAPEIQAALDEGVAIRELVAPRSLERAGATMTLSLQPMKAIYIEGENRARVVPDGDICETVAVAGVFTAIGAEPAENWHLPPRQDQEYYLQLSHAAIIAGAVPLAVCGDLVSPVKSVTHAILSAKQAALALDVAFRQGLMEIPAQLAKSLIGPGPSISLAAYRQAIITPKFQEIVNYEDINRDYFERQTGIQADISPPAQRKHSFAEVENTLTGAAALQEATRCFHCGVCDDCDVCRLFCPEMSIQLFDSPPKRRINLEYCKGCGVCVTECPRHVITLKEEKA